jgi:hypothetical protein
MSRNRISRGLVGLLVIILFAGAGLYVHGVLHARSAMAQVPRLPALLLPPKAASDVPTTAAPTTGPAALVTVTPTAPSPDTAKAASFSAMSPPAMLAAQTAAPSTQPGATLAAWSPTPAMVPPAPPANFLAEAAAKSSTGDLLGARKMLNDALLSGTLSSADTGATKKAMSDLNDTLIFGPRKFPDDEFGGVCPARSGWPHPRGD